MRFYTADEVRQRLQQVVDQRGSQKAIAEEAQVSPSFLSDVLKGHHEPTGNILSYLRMDRKVYYMPVDDRSATPFECLIGEILLSRGEPLSERHTQALRDHLNNMTDAELVYMIRMGKKYP